MTKKPSEYLQQARDLLAKGWIQGQYADTYDKPCQFCASGAVNYTLSNCYSANWALADLDDRNTEEWADRSKTHDAVMHYLKAAVRARTDIQGIVTYNDDPNTTQADILAVFDDAIGLAQANGQ